MTDILTMRDHNQPCEHKQESRQREVGTTYEYTEHFGAYLDEEAGGWMCGSDFCLGGREIKLRHPDWFGDRPGGNATEPLSMWVEVTDD